MHICCFSYILVRGLLTPKEVKKLKEGVEGNPDITKYGYEVDDGKGRKSRLCLWNHPGDDITGTVVR